MVSIGPPNILQIPASTANSVVALKMALKLN
jgi:hypothetical protein